MAQAIALAQLSLNPITLFLGDGSREALEQKVAGHGPAFPWSVEEVLADPLIALIEKKERDIAFLLKKADDGLATVFGLHAKQWAPGGRISLFLEIEGLLQGVFAYTYFEVESELPRKVLCALLRGRETLFLRVSLLNCLELLSACANSPSTRNLFGPPVIDAFRRLAEWFGLKFQRF
jgi:hypothetical protein